MNFKRKINRRIRSGRRAWPYKLYIPERRLGSRRQQDRRAKKKENIKCIHI